jgi:murein DD-endopeptidase MepM/ murein hydrolase activator NlpD
VKSKHGFVKTFLVFALLSGSTGLIGMRPAEAAVPSKPSDAPQNAYSERMKLFEQASWITGIPWYELAAVDQYERSMALVRKMPPEGRLLSIHIPQAVWTGPLNPNPDDTNPKSISLFEGIGLDGDGDGAAVRTNDADVLASMAAVMLKQGASEERRRIALWNYYQNSRAVERIGQFAKLYRTFDKLDLSERAFVMPLGANYTYRSTWGASRGWGGARIHEGTDLFAGYGVPVRSACYGIIEVKGWNPYGGWRIGVRDLNNVYYYFAHLSGFSKELKVGDVVRPGQVLGWVGSSGYGKPGTSGKFPPHLHFGLYRDNGLADWSFDPYPYLRKWEREERQRNRSKRG